MSVNNPDIVPSKHFTSLEEVTTTWRTFTDEGEDFRDEQLLEMRRGRCGVEFGEAREAFVIED